MGGSFVQGDLQAIVVGKVLVSELYDLVKVREFAAVRPKFRERVGRAAGGEGRGSLAEADLRAGEANVPDDRQFRGCQFRCGPRRVPSGANRRLVDVRPGGFVNPVNADIGQVHRQAIGDGALDIQIPLRGVRLTEVRVHRLRGTGRGRVTGGQT